MVMRPPKLSILSPIAKPGERTAFPITSQIKKDKSQSVNTTKELTSVNL